MEGQAPGNPRVCRHCGTSIKWRGEKWQATETLNQKCPDSASGHRPSNKLRPDQLKSIGQTKS